MQTSRDTAAGVTKTRIFGFDSVF